mmetsp:Transcript_21674/g.51007  ORF Transcript_21674/g.51007 Transcript_21674/m.51007 type:complete len:107 (+) Transcript_21674:120-440(+)
MRTRVRTQQPSHRDAERFEKERSYRRNAAQKEGSYRRNAALSLSSERKSRAACTNLTVMDTMSCREWLRAAALESLGAPTVTVTRLSTPVHAITADQTSGHKAASS